MKIQVRQSHIECGKPHSCSRCPVALALWDAGLIHPSISYNTLFAESYRDEYTFPDFVGDKIANYDEGKGMEPFEFEIQKVR